MAKRVVIAGGAGYVGSALSISIARRGCEVQVFDLGWFGPPDWGDAVPAGLSVEARDVFHVTEADLRGADAVVFLAGVSNDPMAQHDPAENFRANAAGPAYLAYVARQAGVPRFVHGGTCSVYGRMPGAAVDETTEPRTDFPYGLSKLQGERACLSMAREDFTVVALRKGTVCGPSPRMRFDLLINRMAGDAWSSGRIQVADPAVWRPVLSVQDAVSAYEAAIDAPLAARAELLNVASFDARVGEVAEAVARVAQWGGRTVSVEVVGGADRRSYRADCGRIRTVLGWSPRSTIWDVSREVWRGLEAGTWEGGPDDDRYHNVRVFARLRDEALARRAEANLEFLQAQRNHYQTLAQLASRGGLSPCEAVAVLEDRPWRSMPNADADAVARLNELVEKAATQ